MSSDNKKSPFFTLFIIFCLILILGFISSYLPSEDFQGVSFKANKIGVVKIEGVIFDSEEILRQLDEFEKNRSVKAIVLRINSPGGAVAPSQEIYHEVMRIKQKKKIVVSMATVAASGGYYIACAADEIFANAGTITGSIGVIMEFSNFQELMGKIGISSQTIKSGKLKDVGNPMRKMTDDERAYLQALILDVYEQFVEDISKGRDLDKESIYPIADGRIMTGREAKKEKLIDEIGTIQDAIKRAAVLGGITGEPDVVYAKKKKIDLFEMFMEETQSRVKQIISEKGFSINYLMKLQ